MFDQRSEGDGGEEPDWVKHERAQFEEHRDKNKDGHMDLQEVGICTYDVFVIFINKL